MINWEFIWIFSFLGKVALAVYTVFIYLDRKRLRDLVDQLNQSADDLQDALDEERQARR